MLARDLFTEAEKLAKSLNHKYITCDHIMYVLCSIPNAKQTFEDLFEELDVEFSKFITQLYDTLKNGDFYGTTTSSPKYSYAVSTYAKIISKLALLSRLPENSNAPLSVFNYMTELLFQPNTLTEEILKSYGIFVEDILTVIEEQQMDPEEKANIRETAVTGSESRAVNSYCANLNEDAKNGKIGKLIGRDTELQDITQILSRKNKNNAVLVGESGVGKTQIVEGLALQIVKGNVPDTLKNKTIYSLNIGSLIAGAKFRGDFEKRLKDLLDDLREDDILFIDEVHTIMGTGASSEGTLDMANMMKPKLSRNEICVIGATTYDEYRRHFEKDPALNRRFMKVDVKEPSVSETKKILSGVKAHFEKFHKVRYSVEAMQAALDLSGKHIHSKFFPDKAIDLLDASGARNATTNKKDTITYDDIAYEVARIANLPLDSLIKSESVKMSTLEKDLKSKVFGQDEAITKLVDSVLISRAGLRGKGTLQGSYLFVGPSGVGKTEIAKALSSCLDNKLVRFDMSEFMEAHTVSKLIGSPPGYVGYNEGNGKLIDTIEKNPDCVLLLDEVEKAHPDVFNLFLQVLDEGQITSSSGKVLKMHNVTVIMTTNLGAKNLKSTGIGFSETKQDDGIDKAVKAFFKPEFINRLDGIVKFNDLPDDILFSVATKFIKELNDDLKQQKVKVKLNKAGIQFIVSKCKEPGMGARPLKRYIAEHIKKPLASEILFGSLVNGGVAEFKVQEDKITLQLNAETADVE